MVSLRANIKKGSKAINMDICVLHGYACLSMYMCAIVCKCMGVCCPTITGRIKGGDVYKAHCKVPAMG